MRMGGTDFPEPLLNVLDAGRLVIFAGAGVSMGPPANLPGFRELARQVAEGTGLSIGEFEPEDRFLGRVKAAGPNVHQIAVQRLQRMSMVLMSSENVRPIGQRKCLIRRSARDRAAVPGSRWLCASPAGCRPGHTFKRSPYGCPVPG